MQELRDSITAKLLEIHDKSQLRIIYAITRTIIRENRLNLRDAINHYPENPVNETWRSFENYGGGLQTKKMCLPTYTSSSDTVLMNADSCSMDANQSESDYNYQSSSFDPSTSRTHIEDPYDFCYLARPVTYFDAPEVVVAKNLYMKNKFKN